MFEGDPDAWAEQQFGRCDLGDLRRTRRVVEYAALQAKAPAGSTNAVCMGDHAAAEGAYRMIRSPHIKATALEEGPFCATAESCAGRKVVLAVQDSTTLIVTTALADSLGEIGKNGSGGRGMLVHSTLAIDGETGAPLGLLDQLRWQRSSERPGKKTRNQRAYKEKESFKWQKSSERISERVATMENIITVCDREADIYEFLQYHVERKQRFVVRAMHDRFLETEEGRLWEYMRERPVKGKYEIEIGQRGAQRGKGKRPARRFRTASMELRSTTVTLCRPTRRRATTKPIRVKVVLASEIDCPSSATPLEWMILTSEPVGSKQAAATVINHYQRRWLIEEFHKCWKTGCRVEERPVQASDNLERIAVITAQVAVRLLQLRSLADAMPERSCDAVLTREQWQCLWATLETGKTFPQKPPTVLWALRAIAKLAGWRDTKRTGRIGWLTLWQGWAKLEERVAGWILARQGV